MMNLNKYIQNREIWVNLIENNEIQKGFDVYNLYIKKLEEYQKAKAFEKYAKKELETAKAILTTKLMEKTNKFFEEKNYIDVALCGSLLIKIDALPYINFAKLKKSLEELSQNVLIFETYKYIFENFPKENKYLKAKAQLCADINDWKNAIELLEKYIHSNSKIVKAEDYNLLGCFCNSYYSDIKRDKNILIKSLESFKNAYKLNKQPLFAKNATVMAGKAFDNETCSYYWNEIVNRFTMNNDDKYDYAAHSLKIGDFENYHKYFGARFKKENNATPFPKIEKPEWNGVEDISDKILLVHTEQGFGDTFLTYGYIPRLINKCKKLILVTQDSVETLFKNNEFGIEVYGETKVNLKELEFDYFIPSMSIATTLKYTRENIGVGGGYIKADQTKVQEFKEKYFNNNKFKIGLSCCGSKIGNKTRDIDIKELLELDTFENIELYYINKDADEESFEIFTNNKINNISKDFQNFADTAAAIENLDLMLTSDNGLLNLAGAMGKKTFALFNYDREFRWFDLSGENVVYYDSVKPFVNDDIDNWQSSVQPAIAEIKKMI